jgi:hypothetical protein
VSLRRSGRAETGHAEPAGPPSSAWAVAIRRSVPPSFALDPATLRCRGYRLRPKGVDASGPRKTRNSLPAFQRLRCPLRQILIVSEAAGTDAWRPKGAAHEEPRRSREGPGSLRPHLRSCLALAFWPLPRFSERGPATLWRRHRPLRPFRSLRSGDPRSCKRTWDGLGQRKPRGNAPRQIELAFVRSRRRRSARARQSYGSPADRARRARPT